MAKKNIITSEKFITPVFRVSFPNLASPKAMTDKKGNKIGDPKFGLSGIWSPKKLKGKDKQRYAKMLEAFDDVSNKAFGVDFDDLGTGKHKNVKTGLRDGEEKDGVEGYGPGTKFASMTTKRRPTIFETDEDGERVEIDEEEVADRVYPGCYCRAKVNLFSYDNEGKGIGMSLDSLLFVEDGERIDGGSKASASDYDEVDDEPYSKDDDEDDEPKKGKKSKKKYDEDDEDEDDAPKSKKKSKYDDEDEDDEPKKKSKKKSKYDEDDEDDED